MVKNIEALAQLGEEKIFDEVKEILNYLGVIKSNHDKEKDELKVKKLVSNYLIVTKFYEEKYGLEFRDFSICVKHDLAHMGYDPKEFNL